MTIRYITSESVTKGHPDKLCDQISDAILDAYLRQDELSRVAIECMISTGLLVIAGEITSTAQLDVKKIARNVLLSVGDDSENAGIDGATCKISPIFPLNPRKLVLR